MHPSNQKELYSLDKYLIEMANLYDDQKLPSKILLSGKKGSGKSTIAYHLINYVFSKSEDFKYDLKNFLINENNKSFKLLNSKSHPNFYLIDLQGEKKIIEVNQIRDMITYTNKSSFNNLPRFIMIDNIDKLNINATNALLKVLEEPNENIFFFLIHNNEKKIIPTLKSRCLTFKIFLTFDETILILNKLLNKDFFEMINIDLINYYNSPGYYFSLINFAKEKKIDLKDCSLISFLKYLINNNVFKKNSLAKEILINSIELYFLKIYKKSLRKNKVFKIYDLFMTKIKNLNKYNLDEESLFMEFKSKILNG